MKKVDVWETIAAIAMHVERERAYGRIPQSELGAYSVASLVSKMNRAAASLHRIETNKANGYRSRDERIADAAKQDLALKSLALHSSKLRITAEVGDMGYVTLSAGAFRLGCLPMEVRS